MNDERILEQQLGRKPRGAVRVITWCATRPPHPQVIRTAPILQDSEPFPTLYYLTCSFLVKEVGKLEQQGYIEKFDAKVIKDTSFRKRFLDTQKDYIRERKALIDKKKFAKLTEDQKEVLMKSGIGGVKNLQAIKCLHAHYAHFLAKGKNPVGKEVDRLIEKDGHVR